MKYRMIPKKRYCRFPVLINIIEDNMNGLALRSFFEVLPTENVESSKKYVRGNDATTISEMMFDTPTTSLFSARLRLKSAPRMK